MHPFFFLLVHHEAHGHRNRRNIILSMEWESGKRLPQWLMEVEWSCAACDAAKITSKTVSKERLLPTTAAGEILSADTIVGYCTSLSGFKHIFHMHDLHTDYGMAWAIKTKEVEHLALYRLKHAANVTGHPAVQLRIDSGEAKTTAVLNHCIEQGTEVVTNLAHVHSN